MRTVKYILTFIAVAVLSACGSPAVKGTVSPGVTTTGSASAPADVVETPEAPDVDKTQLYADHIAEFSGINGDVQAAINDYDFLALGEGCSRLAAWSEEGLALPDIDINDVDDHWDKAMKLYIRAATACVEGALTEDPAKFSQAGKLLTRGADEIELATNELG